MRARSCRSGALKRASQAREQLPSLCCRSVRSTSSRSAPACPAACQGARGTAEAAACTRQVRRRSARATRRSMPNEPSARPALMRAPPLRPARCCRLHAWPDSRVCARYATHVQLRLKPGALQDWLGSARCCSSVPQRNPVISVRAAFSLFPDAHKLHLQERAPQQACYPKPWQGQTGTCSCTAACWRGLLLQQKRTVAAGICVLVDRRCSGRRLGERRHCARRARASGRRCLAAALRWRRSTCA